MMLEGIGLARFATVNPICSSCSLFFPRKRDFPSSPSPKESSSNKTHARRFWGVVAVVNLGT
jgi:hypothetical protein